MNVASKELCQELYELSGWYDEGSPKFYEAGDGNDYSGYTLGYLLPKLPARLHLTQVDWRFSLTNIDGQVKNKDGAWSADYWSMLDPYFGYARTASSTPEGAACKLAIELFKRGVLKKEEIND